MRLSLYYVNSSGRHWADWLDASQVGDPPRTDTVGDQKYYQGEGRFLCLIHRGEDWSLVEQRGYEAKWKSLPEDLRKRVWWLFYSGSGYPRLQSDVANIHYLRYEIDRDQIKGQETQKATLAKPVLQCFRSFLDKLRSDEEPTPPSTWDLLYPADNVAAACLLALLDADGVVDIGQAISKLLENQVELNLAYLQYCSHLKGAASSERRTFHKWLEELHERRYAAVRSDLQQTLGAVPD